MLSVPERRPVAYGLYALEALASGVPIVEPDIGCFPEIVEAAGGGILYAPNTAEKLADSGYARSGKPVCRVWPSPITFNPYRLR